MLSSKYHIAYWVVASVAVAIYRGALSVFGLQAETHLQYLLVPSLAFALYCILRGPRLKSASLCRDTTHYTAAFCLIVSLGSVSHFVHVPGETSPTSNSFIHACLAFSAFGTLEAIRQNVSPTPLYHSDMLTSSRDAISIQHL